MNSFLLFAAMTLLQQVTQSVTIAPGKIEEPCFSLDFEQRLEYSFEASASLDFNIHYHVDADVRFPVNMRDQQSAEGVFIAPESRDYCLMWTNRGAQPATLEYQFRTYGKEGAR